MNKTMIVGLAALVALAGCADEAPKSAPGGVKWLGTIVKTNDGGMLRGNPQAKVKLVAYSAFSCSDCAQFATLSKTALNAYIASGKVSYEFRNFNSDVTDVPATLIAKCGGPKTFFAISEQLFQTQSTWRGSVEKPGALDTTDLASFPPELLAAVLATKLGLDKLGEQRGMTGKQVKACLSDKAAIADIDTVTNAAKARYQVSALPAFLINGRRVDGAKTWGALEPALKAAGG